MNTVMIVTGESSGELYGSLLAKALKEKRPDLHIIGVGGERMKNAGVALISGISSSFGISEAVSSLKAVREAFMRTIEAMEKFHPIVIVLIDYPDFNLRVAKIAKEKGVKILYYVSPQVWAWRKSRIKTIAGLSDRIAVILPFEAGIYKGIGAQCEFVGHPALEEIGYLPKNKDVIKKSLGLDVKRPVLALLPGSRHHELNSLLPVMLEVVKSFKAAFPDYNYQFVIPTAPNIDTERYHGHIQKLNDEGVIVKKENAINVLSASNLSVIASGTATLQAAFLEVPMVVIYKLSPFTFFIAKLIVDVKYISLINLISDKEIVKELLQSRANAKNILHELRKIMFDTGYNYQIIKQFRAVREIFSDKKPSARVAEIILEMTA